MHTNKMNVSNNHTLRKGSAVKQTKKNVVTRGGASKDDDDKKIMVSKKHWNALQKDVKWQMKRQKNVRY
jgi:hypothetical protein